MLRNTTRLALFTAPIALAALIFSAPAGAQKKSAATVPNASLNVTLNSSPTTITACSDPAAQQVQLNAVISQTDNPVKYRWTTTGGTISGEGPVVTWNLAGVKPGYQKASLDVETSGSGGTCQAFSSVSVLVNPCAPVRPVCPAIEVTCPTTVSLDKPLTFTSRATGGTPSVTPVYNWTVSAGTIASGQGTDTITVDTSGLAGQTVRASLSIGGYNLDCAAECAVSIPLPLPTSGRFDEFGDITRNDEKARLDDFAIGLQSDPKATAYVIVYPGKSGKRGEVQYHANRLVDYLVNSRGIDKSRIVTLVGPKREQLIVDLWIVPQGAAAPNPNQ